jgi:hypothetical protein
MELWLCEGADVFSSLKWRDFSSKIKTIFPGSFYYQKSISAAKRHGLFQRLSRTRPTITLFSACKIPDAFRFQVRRLRLKLSDCGKK